MKKPVFTLLLLTLALLTVFGMVSCDKEDAGDNTANTTAAPADAEPVRTVSSELWSSAFEADNYTYTIVDAKPVETVKVTRSEVAAYYPDNSVQYFSKLLDGRVIIKYFSKSGNSSQEYTPGKPNYDNALLSYKTVKDFALVNFVGFYDRFTYDEAKETYIFDGTADNKTLKSNIILKDSGCTYSRVEVSFENGNIIKIYAVDSNGENTITLNLTDHGKTTIDID